jgi:hypothetical protein
VVEMTPFTLDVIIFPSESRPLLFIRLKVVVAGMPLVEFTKVIVFVVLALDRVLLVMILLVATTPFILLVNIFPVADWVKEFMILATRVETPLTIDWKVLVVVAKLFVVVAVIRLASEVVEIEPPIFEVRTEVDVENERVLGTDKLPTVSLVILVVASDVVADTVKSSVKVLAPENI